MPANCPAGCPHEREVRVFADSGIVKQPDGTQDAVISQ
jgi:hypothetical protein